jgi:hypothetical protein
LIELRHAPPIRLAGDFTSRLTSSENGTLHTRPSVANADSRLKSFAVLFNDTEYKPKHSNATQMMQ